MTSSHKKLSIIVTHYRTPDILKECLDALSTHLKHIDHEIIVSDSATEERTRTTVAQKYPNVAFLAHRDNIGFPRLVNAGLKKAHNRFIFVINADIIVRDQKDIERLIVFMETHRDAGVVGPKLLNTDGSIQQSAFRSHTPLTLFARRTKFGNTLWGKSVLSRFTYGERKGSEPQDVEWLMGSAFLLERERFAKIGGMLDDRFFMYFEDVDLCRRFRNAGLRVVYLPDSVMTHRHIRASHGGRGMADIILNRLTRVHIKSYISYLWKWNIEVPMTKLFGEKHLK